jgi:hypothetical protein
VTRSRLEVLRQRIFGTALGYPVANVALGIIVEVLRR